MCKKTVTFYRTCSHVRTQTSLCNVAVENAARPQDDTSNSEQESSCQPWLAECCGWSGNRKKTHKLITQSIQENTECPSCKNMDKRRASYRASCEEEGQMDDQTDGQTDDGVGGQSPWESIPLGEETPCEPILVDEQISHEVIHPGELPSFELDCLDAQPGHRQQKYQLYRQTQKPSYKIDRSNEEADPSQQPSHQLDRLNEQAGYTKQQHRLSRPDGLSGSQPAREEHRQIWINYFRSVPLDEPAADVRQARFARPRTKNEPPKFEVLHRDRSIPPAPPAPQARRPALVRQSRFVEAEMRCESPEPPESASSSHGRSILPAPQATGLAVVRQSRSVEMECGMPEPEPAIWLRTGAPPPLLHPEPIRACHKLKAWGCKHDSLLSNAPFQLNRSVETEDRSSEDDNHVGDDQYAGDDQDADQSSCCAGGTPSYADPLPHPETPSDNNRTSPVSIQGNRWISQRHPLPSPIPIELRQRQDTANIPQILRCGSQH